MNSLLFFSFLYVYAYKYKLFQIIFLTNFKIELNTVYKHPLNSNIHTYIYTFSNVFALIEITKLNFVVFMSFLNSPIFFRQLLVNVFLVLALIFVLPSLYVMGFTFLFDQSLF